MLLKKTHNFNDGTVQTCFVLKKCKYCGKSFIKLENKILFCSDTCRRFSRLESKAKYQRKRRKLINNGVLISNENKQVGTTFLSKHAHLDYKKEYKSINNEMKRLGLVSCNIGVEDND